MPRTMRTSFSRRALMEYRSSHGGEYEIDDRSSNAIDDAEIGDGVIGGRGDPRREPEHARPRPKPIGHASMQDLNTAHAPRRPEDDQHQGYLAAA